MFDFVISFFQRIAKPPDSILISLLVAGRGRWYARNAPGSIGCAVQQAEQHVPAPAGRRGRRQGIPPMEEIWWSAAAVSAVSHRREHGGEQTSVQRLSAATAAARQSGSALVNS